MPVSIAGPVRAFGSSTRATFVLKLAVRSAFVQCEVGVAARLVATASMAMWCTGAGVDAAAAGGASSAASLPGIGGAKLSTSSPCSVACMSSSRTSVRNSRMSRGAGLPSARSFVSGTSGGAAAFGSIVTSFASNAVWAGNSSAVSASLDQSVPAKPAEVGREKARLTSGAGLGAGSSAVKTRARLSGAGGVGRGGAVAAAKSLSMQRTTVAAEAFRN
mmetsp:Transcript_27363/g.88408  ORF Transcript_27363/g.88408 Transcript_27363/m.88408 type:complete len:218 (+) Transcript_27363:515-1168(+)